MRISNLKEKGFLFVDRFVPESPRWLMVHKRSKEAKKVFQTMANVNGHVITPEFLNDMQKVIFLITLNTFCPFLNIDF